MARASSNIAPREISMPTTSKGALCVTRPEISGLARRIARETGLPHAKAIALVAEGLGYADGNALMGALKRSEPRTSAPRAPAGYRYDIRFSFVIDDGDAIPNDLANIARMCDEGPAVGGKLEIEGTPLTRDELGAHAVAYGATEDFFFGDE
jgi:hypothetical protein